jgi:hypothetical protein
VTVVIGVGGSRIVACPQPRGGPEHSGPRARGPGRASARSA